MRVYEVLLVWCLSISSVLANFNFDNYPECAQTICYALAPQSCNDPHFRAPPNESCFCTNAAFIIDLAGQIFNTCGCRTLKTSAQVQNDYCAKSQTDSAVSVEYFISLGDGGHTSCGTGLGSGAIAGIVIGVLALVVAIGIGVLHLAVGVWGLLPERYAPWPYIQRFFRCCCCYLPRAHPEKPETIPLPPYSP